VDGFRDPHGGVFYLPVSTKKLHLQRQNAGDAAPVEVRFVAESWQDAFWLSVAALVEEFGSKLRRCQECKGSISELVGNRIAETNAHEEHGTAVTPPRPDGGRNERLRCLGCHRAGRVTAASVLSLEALAWRSTSDSDA